MSGGFRQFVVTPEVVTQARKLGLFGNVEKRVQRMARRSAPFTHPLGNRRFESIIMKIENGIVVSIANFDPDTGKVTTDVMTRLSQKQKALAAIEKHFGTTKVSES